MERWFQRDCAQVLPTAKRTLVLRVPWGCLVQLLATRLWLNCLGGIKLLAILSQQQIVRLVLLGSEKPQIR